MKKNTASFAIVFTLLLCFPAFAIADEPQPPDVTAPVDPDTEIELEELGSLPGQVAFEKLKELRFSVDGKLAHRGVFKAYGKRKGEALELAGLTLALPVVRRIGGEVINRSSDYRVARRILEVFSSDAHDVLFSLYENGNPTTRGSVISVSAKIASPRIRDLLLSALRDRSSINEESAEDSGSPMRVCDIAYNQLVLRYRVQGVLRTIGSGHSPDQRDEHIQILESILRR